MAQSMSKLLIFVLVIQFLLTITGYTTITGSFVSEFFEDPSAWGGTAWLQYFLNLSSALVIGGAAVVITGSLWTKNDFIIMAGFTAVLIGLGIPLYHFWDAMAKGFGSTIVAVLVISPVAIIYIMAAVAWWRALTT